MRPYLAEAFVAGGLAVGLLVVGLFFLRFWTRTRDGLFLSFAVAFWLLAIGQAAPIVMGLAAESRAGVYLLRLAAFGLIIAAILAKNLQAGRGRRR